MEIEKWKVEWTGGVVSEFKFSIINYYFVSLQFNSKLY